MATITDPTAPRRFFFQEKGVFHVFEEVSATGRYYRVRDLGDANGREYWLQRSLLQLENYRTRLVTLAPAEEAGLSVEQMLAHNQAFALGQMSLPMEGGGG